VASVELLNVHKRFGNTHVVRGVSLAIEPGEFLVLVGRSGCGKSTCLRMIAGLEESSDGEIRIDGRRVNELAPKERDVGMVFQSYALYPHMTVRENIAFGLKLRKVPAGDITARVTEVAKMLELEPLLARFPRELSGGQRQRVAMGRAIARRPRVFLFDEPLSNLDAALRVQMRAELAGLHRGLKATMVYVTHDQVEAMTLATRIAVLEGGVLQQVDRPLELFHKPANRFVAGFIGSPAMNFIEGTLGSREGAPMFESKGVHLRLASAPAGISAGDPLTLGVRPNDIAIGNALAGTVDAVEPMGWEAYAYVRTDAGRLVVRLEGAAAGIRAGESLSLAIDPARVHLFAADGRALRDSATAGRAAAG
jgi:multiple sugar transport system ATP-binding protein